MKANVSLSLEVCKYRADNKDENVRDIEKLIKYFDLPYELKYDEGRFILRAGERATDIDSLDQLIAIMKELNTEIILYIREKDNRMQVEIHNGPRGY